MDNQNNGYGQGVTYPQGGRLNASRSGQGKPAPRPSMDDLAPYSAVNYTSRGMKGAHKQTKKRRIILVAVAAAIVLLLVIPGVAVAVSAKSAMDDAKIMMNQGSTLVSQIQSGDVEGAQRTAQNLSSIAKELDSTVYSPLWKPLTLVPVLGEDIKSVRTLASVAYELSEKVLVPMTEGLSVEGSARLFADGGFNVSVIQALLVPIGAESVTIQECAERVNAMSDPHIAQLAQPIVTVKQLMGVLDEISGYAGDLSQALPGLLGVNGPRTYLVIACTEAELRSVGGYPGSAGLMTINNGKIEIGSMDAPSVPIVSPEDDVLQLTDEEWNLFGSRSGECFYDGGYNPDFPRAAEIMKSIWDADERSVIDGILSIDPMFLQSILALTGSITASDGVVVDGTNAAEVLSNTVYAMYRPEMYETEAAGDLLAAKTIAKAKQDAFFGEVASLALDCFFANIDSVDMLKFIQVLGEAIDNKRIYMWVTDANEQALLEKLDAACSLSFDMENPELGVYLATTIAGKTNWYTKVDTEISSGTSNSNGSESYEVTTTITNTLPPEEAGALPAYVVNPDQYAEDRIRAKGDMILDVYLFAPAGGFISDIYVDGEFAPENIFDDMFTWYTKPGPDPMTKASYDGREVWYGVTMINCLQSTTIKYKVTTSSQAISSLCVDTTPLAREWS